MSLHNMGLAVTLAVILGGCTSTRLEDAVPQQASDRPVPEQNLHSGGILPQITPQERDRIQSQIDAARAGQAGGGRTRVELSGDELRAIARGHAEEALEEIEGEE